MSAPKDTEWSEREIDRLQEMWDEQGLSASEIAVVLRRSRSAVVGKVRRLHLSRRRRSPVKSFVAEKRPRRPWKHDSGLVPEAIDDTRSFTARLMGDLLPGRSALDKKSRSPRVSPIINTTHSTTGENACVS